jgi:hypothetical protein
VNEEILREPSNYMGTGPTEAATIDQADIRQAEVLGGAWGRADWETQAAKWRHEFDVDGEHFVTQDGSAYFYQGT